MDEIGVTRKNLLICQNRLIGIVERLGVVALALGTIVPDFRNAFLF